MDRVSDLPDEVLCHILSFLTTKEAALTSILAKRWRNLLAFLPCLTIDDSLLLHPQYGSQETKRSFTDFVDTVLGNNNSSSPPLNKLSLNFDTFAYADRLDGWISNALARGVSDLALKIDRGIDISLVAGGLLKTLALDSVWVCPKEFDTLLLPALPSLDELVLVNVWWKDRDVNVSSASLKTLTIVSRYWLNFTTLSFDTPSLLRFKYSGCNEPDFRVVDMGNLVDAHIFLDLCRRSCNVENPQVEHHQVAAAAAIDYTNVRKLFHGVRNVLNLVLFPATFEVLFACSQSMPAFENLKSFAIKSDKGCGWQAMPALLRNCPRLETLVIEGLMQDVTSMWMCGGVCNCISREGKGLSLGFCRVRLLKIHRFQGTVKEMEIIKHFLDSLPCLEEMRVYVEEKNSLTTELENREVSKRVLEMFQLYKKSSSCNVKLMVGDVLCI